MPTVEMVAFSMERVVRAVERVRERLERVADALNRAEIPYAIVGGNAVAFWVARVDEAAVRNTRDVDVMLNRGDLPAAQLVLEQAGFRYRHAAGVDMFLDGENGSAREAVHVVFAGELVRPGEPQANPKLGGEELFDEFRVLPLKNLVEIKLTAYRRKDQVHLLDMIDLGIIDASWLPKLPDELAIRLQTLLDDPNG